MSANRQAPPCPRCGAHETVPIVYGHPSAEAFEAAERDEIVLGGCVVTPDLPIWLCRACDHRWGRLGDGREE